MLTMKFGGTSVGDIQRLREVVSIVQSYLNRKPIVVASAMGGVTDLLLETAQLAVQRKIDQVGKKIDALREKHFQVIAALVKAEDRRKDLHHSQSLVFDELTNLYHGVSLLRELSVRSLDAIASFGEILSCMQIAAILTDHDIPAQFVDARTLVRTDAHFGEAAVDFSVTNAGHKKSAEAAGRCEYSTRRYRVYRQHGRWPHNDTRSQRLRLHRLDRGGCAW